MSNHADIAGGRSFQPGDFPVGLTPGEKVVVCLLQPTEDIGCDFNKAADYITVSIISDLCLIGESLGTLHEKETETILANATKYVIELAK